MPWLRRRKAPRPGTSVAEVVAPYGYNMPPAVPLNDRVERLLVTVALQSQRLEVELDRLAYRLDSLETALGGGQLTAALHAAHLRMDALEADVEHAARTEADLEQLAQFVQATAEAVPVLASLDDRIASVESALTDLTTRTGFGTDADLEDFKAHAAAVSAHVARLSSDLRADLARLADTARLRPPAAAAAAEAPEAEPSLQAEPEAAEALAEVEPSTRAEPDVAAESEAAAEVGAVATPATVTPNGHRPPTPAEVLIDLTDDADSSQRGWPLSI